MSRDANHGHDVDHGPVQAKVKDPRKSRINDAEIVLGNSTAATHRADYSPNTGDDLDDLTTGSPAFNATGVIAG